METRYHWQGNDLIRSTWDDKAKAWRESVAGNCYDCTKEEAEESARLSDQADAEASAALLGAMDEADRYDLSDVQIDRSGVGHCWRPIEDDTPADHREMLACWIIEDSPAPGDETTIGGVNYRLAPLAAGLTTNRPQGHNERENER